MPTIDTTSLAIKWLGAICISCVFMFCVLLAIRPDVKIDPIVALAASGVSLLGGFIGGVVYEKLNSKVKAGNES